MEKNEFIYSALIINIDELWLKGNNRHFYFKSLKNHIRLVSDFYYKKQYSISSENHRFVLQTENYFSNSFVKALSKIPGIHSIIPAIKTDKDFDKIFPAVKKELDQKDLHIIKSFRISTKRADKTFSPDSMEVSKRIGSMVLDSFRSLKVDLTNPDVTIGIRILSDHIYISSSSIRATGGLPIGTGGHIITLLSGGIDSPVASYLMSKRGCKQTFLFFYAYPLVSSDVKDKIKKLASILAGYQKYSKLYIIPFGNFQKKISKLCIPGYRTLLFRKYMMELAAILAEKIRAEALLTGDSLGQVSSQTLKNISVLEQFTPITVLRPLIGFNKIETINIAKKIGTYDVSIIPFDDACSMLSPKHPILKADSDYMRKFFYENDFSEELNELLINSEIIDMNPTGIS